MTTFQHEFITSIPISSEMKSGVLYISIPFSTSSHLCPCGCREEVVLKISPNRWRLTFDGETVSLYPSVGNWSLPCQSHYWIKNNQIKWAEKWSIEKVARIRKMQDEGYWKKIKKKFK